MPDSLENLLRSRKNLIGQSVRRKVKTASPVPGTQPATAKSEPTTDGRTDSHSSSAATTSDGENRNPTLPYFFIRHQGRWQKIVVPEIRFIESRKNYSKLSTSQGDFVALITLKRLEALLAPHLPASTICIFTSAM
jgi:hypothetical protein